MAKQVELDSFRDFEFRAQSASLGWLRPKDGATYYTIDYMSGAIDDQLWDILDAFGVTLSLGLGHKEARYYNLFAGQARNHYDAAKKTGPETAPLLYYYCFLNLMKAGLVSRAVPGYSPGRYPNIEEMGHGLSVPRDATNNNSSSPPDRLQTDIIRIPYKPASNKSRPNAFYNFHQSYLKCSPGGEQTPDTESTVEINPAALLAYMRSVSTIYRMSRSSVESAKSKLLDCHLAVLSNTDDTKAWGVVRIAKDKYSDSFWDHNEDFESFHRKYKRVDLDPRQIQRLYGYNFEGLGLLMGTADYHYYQGQPTSIESGGYWALKQAVEQEFMNLMQGKLQFTYIESDRCLVALPYRNDGVKLAINETIATYIMAFYLGDLVRYSPDAMDELLKNDKTRAVVSCFIRNSPLVALHDLVCWATGVNHIIRRSG